MARLIDADAFSERYGNYYAEEGPAEGFIGTVGELIAKQPTIEAEPVRHGRWIKEGHGGAIYSACSECGAMMNLPWFWYCGKCGAKMDRGEDDG